VHDAAYPQKLVLGGSFTDSVTCEGPNERRALCGFAQSCQRSRRQLLFRRRIPTSPILFFSKRCLRENRVSNLKSGRLQKEQLLDVTKILSRVDFYEEPVSFGKLCALSSTFRAFLPSFRWTAFFAGFRQERSAP
jgi:hypothetical protein